MEVIAGGTLCDVLPSVQDSDGEFPTGQILLDSIDEKLANAIIEGGVCQTDATAR